jgi:hypothetical protein
MGVSEEKGTLRILKKKKDNSSPNLMTHMNLDAKKLYKFQVE